MRTILIVEPDGMARGRMARTLERGGYRPQLGARLPVVLGEGGDLPDAILLALDDFGEEFLRRLQRLPETSSIPVVGLTGRPEVAARFRNQTWPNLADILLKPVPETTLLRVVELTRTDQAALDWDSLPLPRDRQGALIRRLILEGPDLLVFHVCRRLIADAAAAGDSQVPAPLSWTEIAEWARRLGALEAEETSYLSRPGSCQCGT